MQNRKPLQAKALLKAKKGLQAKNSLKPRSERTNILYETQRIPFVKALLANFPNCMAVWDETCSKVSVDVNEIVSRGAGGKIVPKDWDGSTIKPEYLKQYMTVCRNCHSNITQNPPEAEKRGFRKWYREK